MTLDQWFLSFRPEHRSQGQRFVDQEKVMLRRSGDTTVQGFVQSYPPCSVSLSTESIDHSSLICQKNCTCKVPLCKHLWAILVIATEKYTDFLESKTDIDVKSNPQIKEKRSFAGHQKNDEDFDSSPAVKEKKESFKNKFRRTAKEKREEKNLFFEGLPDDVRVAVTYYLENGFDFTRAIDKSEVDIAKKKLSRVFHPDRGGTHQEIVELNAHTQALVEYLRSQ